MNTAPMLQGYTPMQQKKNIVKTREGPETAKVSGPSLAKKEGKLLRARQVWLDMFRQNIPQMRLPGKKGKKWLMIWP